MDGWARDLGATVRASQVPVEDFHRIVSECRAALATSEAARAEAEKDREEAARKYETWRADAGARIVDAQLERDEAEAARAELERERDAWKETGAGFLRDAEFYRGLLDDCAKHLGPAVFVSDDGSVQDSPLRLKVPELLAQAIAERDAARVELETLRAKA